MNNEILKFEIRKWFKSPIWYFFTISFFLFALVTLLGTAGYFDGPSNSDSNVKLLNSSFELTSIGFLFGKLLLFIVAVVAGYGLIRDYKSNSHSLIYSYPISKSYYINGKLFSALIMISLSCLITFSGLLVGELILGNTNPRIGPISLAAYISSFLVYLLPTIISISIFTFTLVGFTRNVFSGFVIIIFFVLFQLMIENVLFDNIVLSTLLDPFGQTAFLVATESWDFKMKNANFLPINKLVVINRILWLILSLLALKFFYSKFDFQYDSILKFKSNKKQSSASLDPNPIDNNYIIKFNYSSKARLQTFLNLMKFDFLSILKSWMFWILAFAGILTILFIQLKVTHTGEFVLHPHTRLLLAAPLNIYSQVIIFGTFIFSAFLVQRAKRNGISNLIDVTCIKNWQLILSKVTAIAIVQICFLLLFLICSIAVQIFNGYSNFELSIYAYHIFILILPMLLIWNFTSIFVHSLIPNIYLSLFFLICIWLGAQSIEQIGLDTNLLKFNLLPQIEYSDFQGYGHHLKSYQLLLVYWFLFGLILFACTFLIWNRGSLLSLKERMNHLKSRLNPTLTAIILLLIVNFSFLGFKVYQGESINSNSISASKIRSQKLTEYKKEWQLYSNLKLPKLRALSLNLDLYPKEQKLKATGEYLIVNDSEESIDTILLRTGFDENTKLTSFENATLIKQDSFMKTYLYKVKNSLQPGDSIKLNFEIESSDNNLFSRNSNVLKKGTFLPHDFLPRLGYQFEDKIAHEHVGACKHNFYYKDADLIDLHTTISTSKDQIALAPGILLSEKTIDERRIFEYETEEAIKFNFSFHSSDFTTNSEQYKGIELSSFYLKGHEKNLNKMLDGIKASIDFNTKHFGPYPYSSIRIAEFPHTEESYTATLTANNIPTSELLFNMNTDALEGKLNLPFYVMAHELTHQWFGNQVMPADLAGAKMLTESITEYITLCIYRKQFGEKIANEFLRLQHQRYNRGRRKESQRESSLDKVLEHQQYVAYGKGAITFNALADRIGEEKVIDMLGKYLKQFSGQTKNYPSTQDFLTIVKKETDSLHHTFIDQAFSHICHNENEIKSLKKIDQKKVVLEIFIKSIDTTLEKEISIKDESFQLGQMGLNGEILKIHSFKMNSGLNKIELDVESETDHIVLDPRLLMIDHDLNDNKIIY